MDNAIPDGTPKGEVPHYPLSIVHCPFDSEGFSIALLPDHPTPCEHRTHTAEPIPFCIYYPGLEPDSVQTFDEDACKEGAYGLLEGDEFIKLFMQ